MNLTPRIRTDLTASPAEEQGVKYFDVSDPRSGARMRLYDFEWLIAARMDGTRPFGEVAEWARQQLGLNPTSDDLAEYARKLAELGFFELGADELSTPLPAAIPANEIATKPFPRIDNPSLDAEGDPEIEPVSGSHPLPSAPSSPAPVKPAATAATLPGLPPSPPRAPRAAAATAFAERSPRTEATPDPGEGRRQKRSGMGSMLGIGVVVLLVAAGVGYVVMGSAAPHVTLEVASSREVVRLYNGSATLTGGVGQTLSFGEPGKVSDVAAAGTAVKAGMPVATLDSYSQVEKSLNDIRDRLNYYERTLEKSKAKNIAADIQHDQAKVNEKKKLLAELEARIARVRLLAPADGTVAQVLVKPGVDVVAGQPVVRLGAQGEAATFTIPVADASRLTQGAAVAIQPASGGPTLAARVKQVTRAGANAMVAVEVAGPGAPKVGTAVRMVSSRVPNVVPVPAAALVERDGTPLVFVFSAGVARARQVTVLDRADGQVLLSNGITPGESVITSGVANLREGQKVSASP